MDLSCFATKDNANEGKWFQVELYGKKQNFGLLILGSDSDVVEKLQREQFKKLDIIGSIAGRTKTEEEVEDVLDNDDGVVSRIVGIKTWDNEDEPVVLNDITLKNDEKSFKYLIEQIPAIKKFVLDKSNLRKNFLSEEKKN